MLFFAMLLVIFSKDGGFNVPLKYSADDDKDLIKYSKVGLPVYFVIKDGFDYSMEANQDKVWY